MKTKEELITLKNEFEALSAKLAELTGEELEQVTGGIAHGRTYWKNRRSPDSGDAVNDADSNGVN